MREFPVPGSQFQVGLRTWFRELRNLLSRVTGHDSDDRSRSRLANTTDDGMTDLLARAITVGAGSRWERATVRATIGLHATRVRDDGVSGEQGLMHFKRILHRAMPPTPVQTADQARVAKEMVRWWVEAYYERDT